MLRGAVHALWHLLRRPLFGTIVIPKDARVDPAQFPEDQFPVHCVKCGYWLRGLPDGRCPECGEPFERGRLLVRQYVHGRIARRRKRALVYRVRHYCAIAFWGCYLIPVGTMVAALLASELVPPNSPGMTVRMIRAVLDRNMSTFFLMMAVVAILGVAHIVLTTLICLRGRHHRAAVLSAIRAQLERESSGSGNSEPQSPTSTSGSV